MPPYLTERQKTMLRAIVPGLKAGTIQTRWHILYGDDAIMAINGFDGRNRIWPDVTESDLDDFEELGLIERVSMINFQAEYRVYKQQIIDFVEKELAELPEPQTNPTNLAPHMKVSGQRIPSIFLSHNSKDKPFVRKLAERLKRHGVSVWLDEAELNIGD